MPALLAHGPFLRVRRLDCVINMSGLCHQPQLIGRERDWSHNENGGTCLFALSHILMKKYIYLQLCSQEYVQNPCSKAWYLIMLSWHDFERNVGDTLHLLDQLSWPQGGRLVNFLQT